MEEDIRVLLKSADANAEKAESQEKLSFISKSNAFEELQKKRKEVCGETKGT